MDLTQLDTKFEKLLQALPKKRRELVEENGNALKQKVMTNLSGCGHEDVERLKKGVTKVMGVKGDRVTISYDPTISPHTYQVENGYKVIKGDKVVGWVSGNHMYRNALNTSEEALGLSSLTMIESLVGDIFD
ncbi:MAG: hypothetical protein AB9856_21080 [Cellulosilyticaceae bacterium]